MFKKPFSFEGRIRRKEYGLTLLIYLALYIVILALSTAGGSVEGLLILVLVIPLVWFVWAQGAKRCHDMDKSGWWQLIPFYFFVMLFQDGYPGRNEYGASPKFPDDEANMLSSETLDGHLAR